MTSTHTDVRFGLVPLVAPLLGAALVIDAAGANMTEFFKNLGMMGGLLMVAAYGAGTWSLDWRRMRRGAPPAAPSYERT